MSKKYDYDVAIIGAGPVGLFAAFEAGVHGLSVCVIDGLPFVGGQCSLLYPDKFIYDIPGYVEITAKDLSDRLYQQAARSNPTYYLGCKVSNIGGSVGNFTLSLTDGKTISVGTVMLAIGNGDFKPKKPPMLDLSAYEDHSVFYAVDNKEKFRGQQLMIAGGGDSAADWTINLAPIASKIYLLHRREKFRCAPASLEQINKLVAEGKVELVAPYQLKDVAGSGDKISSVTVCNAEGSSLTLDVDALLLFFGMETGLKFLSWWDVKIDYGLRGIDVNSVNMETNIAGIYAIGDVAVYEGKNKLIVNGFAEAVGACVSARAVLNPDKVYNFEYSTTQFSKQDSKK